MTLMAYHGRHSFSHCRSVWLLSRTTSRADLTSIDCHIYWILLTKFWHHRFGIAVLKHQKAQVPSRPTYTVYPPTCILPNYLTHSSHTPIQPTYLTHLSYPLISPTHLTHSSHPLISPTQITHLSNPPISPIYQTHISHPHISPTHLTHSSHPLISPTHLTHLSNPPISPIYLDA